MASLQIKGLEPLMAAFTAAGEEAPKLAARALHEEALEAFSISQLLVPVEYGVLRSSGVVHPPVISGTKTMVRITYGGGAADYAIYVHEFPPSRARHASPTRWKYLEYPVKRYSEGMAARMAARVLDLLHRRFV